MLLQTMDCSLDSGLLAVLHANAEFDGGLGRKERRRVEEIQQAHSLQDTHI